MKTIFLFCILLTFAVAACPQDLPARLSKAWTAFRQDPQLAHASASLYVIDAGTGAVVLDRDSRVGLAPASTQKVITSVTAFELLGPSFRFATEFGYTGSISNGRLKGNIVIRGSGDPTLGSWRYGGATGEAVTSQLLAAIQHAGITAMDGFVFADDRAFSSATIPGGWIWDDIGNYYGAGASALNWRENQYDLYFKPGRLNEPPEILRTDPALYQVRLVNELTTDAKGTGDNSYIYLPPYSSVGYLRGTIPMENNFKISGSFPDPSLQTAYVFTEALKAAGYDPGVPDTYHNYPATKQQADEPFTRLFTHHSPSLDSIIYWFDKKSINLYGEALVKRIAADKTGTGSTQSGVDIIRQFWKSKGVDIEEMDLADGSGLSPQNRITTHAQVEVLRFAINRPWYRDFVDALPEYNGMKMKSGTIRKVKGFCGYHRSASGRTYIFSILVNNYSGASSALVAKMYNVLDLLK